MPVKINWPALGFVILPNIGGCATGHIVSQNIKWYRSLNKPEWTPPEWAFGPVWTALYSSIGYASYLVYRDGGGFESLRELALPLSVYGSNVLLNWAWAPIFFGKRDMKLALYEIQLINISAVATSYLFWKVNRTAGYLIIPYCLWLGVATTLNYVYYKKNAGGSKIEDIKEKLGKQ